MHDRAVARFILAATIPSVLAAAPIAAQTYFPADSVVRATAQPFLVRSSALGIVVGLLGADGTRRVIAVGNPRFDGRTIFEIGSISKVFTGILLAEMVERGEVRLDDPVSGLLPDSVLMPAASVRPITLVDLATHTSGLPREPDNLRPSDPRNPYADFSTDRLYDFLRRHQPRRDAGVKFQYSNLGMGLLGHVLSLRAATPYEALLRERILGPLGLTSTAITLDDSLKLRLAPGRSMDLDVLAGAGALRSSAEDLLGFLAANLDPPDTPLGRAMRRSHEPRFRVGRSRWIGLAWESGYVAGHPYVGHGGATVNYHGFIGFDPERRIGVVVLTNSQVETRPIALHLLSPSYPLMSSGQRRAFRILALVLAVVLVAGVRFVWARAGASQRRASLVSGLTVAVAFGMILGGEYVSIAAAALPTLDTWARLLIIGVPLALSVVVGVSRMGARLAELPLVMLVGFQSFRVVLAVVLHRVYLHGVQPLPDLGGWNVDIVTGILALVLTPLIGEQRVGMRMVRAWNWLGCILLLSLVAIAWSNAWSSQTTLIGLPVFLIPIALLGHLVMFRKLASRAPA